MTTLYLERYLNYGLTREELQSGRPIIGIAQTGSDLVPCNRIHVALAERVKQGTRDTGGIPLLFPVHPTQETGRRQLNLPAIALSGGPMLNGDYLGRCVGSGIAIWEARRQLANGEIDSKEFMRQTAGTSGAPSILNASPEAVDGGGLAWLATGDGVRIDLNNCTVNTLMNDEEWQRRKQEKRPVMVENQTWWQELYRREVSNLDRGAVFNVMTGYRKIVARTPRDSH